MFSRKKRTALSDEVATIISQNTSVKGSVNTSSSLRIDWEFEGEVITTSDLIVGESARIKVTVAANNAVIAGTVAGNMTVVDNLELLSSAKVTGDIKVGSLIIDDGAVFEGNCEMKNEAE